MSDESIVDRDVLLEHVDVEKLLSGNDVDESIEAEELGSAVGGELGATVGREFGAAVGGRCHDAVESRLEADGTLGDLFDDLGASLSTSAVGATLRSLLADLRDALAVSGLLGDETAERDESEEDGDSEPSESEDATSSATDEEGASGGGDDLSNPPESRDELDSMSYRSLQRLAKRADVSANLSHDEMVEELASELGIDE